MAEQDLQPPQASFDEPAGAGVQLRRAREVQKLSRADIAARTKIAERHLTAIEEERFSDLASSTYAVGFSRAYARAVGLDEREIAQLVRGELNMVEEAEAPTKQTFEPGDPARVPSSRAAWLAGGAALAVLVAVGVFWRSYIFPAASLPDLTSDAPPSEAAPAPPTEATAAAPAQGPVVITATRPGVWVKITDENGQQLFQKEMAQGESYTVPVDAAGPQLRTARPDALSVTVGGRAVPALADKSSTITVPLSGAALLARGTATAPAALPPMAATAPTQTVPSAIAPPQTRTVPVASPQQAAPAPARTAQTPASAAPTARATPTAAPSARVASPAATPSARPSPAGNAPAAVTTSSATKAPAAVPSPPPPPPPPAAAEAAAAAPAAQAETSPDSP